MQCKACNEIQTGATFMAVRIWLRKHNAAMRFLVNKNKTPHIQKYVKPL